MPAPRFSIVVHLPDARGLAERCVRSWTAQQDFARDRFELVVMSDGRESGLEASVLPLLGTADRLLVYAGASRTELYDRGARAARGEFVVLTESHCLAEPAFLCELDRYLTSADVAGACCRNEALPGGALARLAARAFDDGYRRYCRPGDWRKVNVHSFAIRRDAYLEAGGLNPRYGVFAEMLLADELRRRGHRLGFAEAPAVWHRFDSTAAESVAFNRDAVAGEMRYRRDHPRRRINHTFLTDGDQPWSDRELARAALAALWSERAFGAALRQAWRVVRLAASEGWAARALDRATAALAATGCRLLGSRWAPARWLYLKSWAAAARLARKEYLATEPPEPVRPAGTTYRIDDLPERDLWGFHPPERREGEPLRWTKRCAVVRLPRPAGACELTLHTRAVGWPLDGRCAFFVDGRRLPAEAVTVEPDRVRLCVGSARPGPMLLAVVCDPVRREVRGAAERRELGLPLFHIDVQPVGEPPKRGARRAQLTTSSLLPVVQFRSAGVSRTTSL